MNRYSLEIMKTDDPEVRRANMNPHPKGDYVLYSDVKVLIKERDEARAEYSALSCAHADMVKRCEAAEKCCTEARAKNTELRKHIQDNHECAMQAIGAYETELSDLKLRLSGRTYCHSDESVEARCQKLEAENDVLKDEAAELKDSICGVKWISQRTAETHAAGRLEGMEEAKQITRTLYQGHREQNAYYNLAINDVFEAIRQAATQGGDQ